MLRKSFKILCLALSVLMVFATTPVFAVDGSVDAEGLHDNCLYSCEHDFDLSLSYSIADPIDLSDEAVLARRAAIDAEGIHDNCIYSCEHTPALTNYVIPYSTVGYNLLARLDIHEIELIVNSTPENERGDLEARYPGITEFIEWRFGDALAEEMAEMEAKFIVENNLSELQVQASKVSKAHYHMYVPQGCRNNHASAGTCRVSCLQTGLCSGCSDMQAVYQYHDQHNWSVGWCGKTCMGCGAIVLLHAPGGCFYCKK